MLKGVYITAFVERFSFFFRFCPIKQSMLRWKQNYVNKVSNKSNEELCKCTKICNLLNKMSLNLLIIYIKDVQNDFFYIIAVSIQLIFVPSLTILKKFLIKRFAFCTVTAGWGCPFSFKADFGYDNSVRLQTDDAGHVGAAVLAHVACVVSLQTNYVHRNWKGL